MACLAPPESNPATDGCCPLAATDMNGFMLCQAASACMRSGTVNGGPCNMGGDITSCYCGTNAATCDTTPNGPCITTITAAAAYTLTTKTTDSPTPAQVGARQGDSNFPFGRAANIQGEAGLDCPTQCGL